MIQNYVPGRTHVLAVFLLFGLGACATVADGKIAASCVKAGGKWIADTRECEIEKADWCKARKGTFDRCASACRNTRQQTCIMVCVPVCKLP